METNVYFVTINTRLRFPYFQSGELCRLLVDQMTFTSHLLNFSIDAYCILYDHVHLIISGIQQETNISNIMKSLKQNFSLHANQLMEVSTMHSLKYFPTFVWHKSFYDIIINSSKTYEKAMQYTIYNYTHHGLPENWPYTSLQNPIS